MMTLNCEIRSLWYFWSTLCVYDIHIIFFIPMRCIIVRITCIPIYLLDSDWDGENGGWWWLFCYKLILLLFQLSSQWFYPQRSKGQRWIAPQSSVDSDTEVEDDSDDLDDDVGVPDFVADVGVDEELLSPTSVEFSGSSICSCWWPSKF